MESNLKFEVKKHWESEVCGTRYGTNVADRRSYFLQIAHARYTLEPYILSFAEFEKAKNSRVLEIGVGAGTDFQNWCQYAAHAVGVDLSHNAVALTKERLILSRIPSHRYSLLNGDVEKLTFESESFDLVYSWGVLHHTPETVTAFHETYRVLKPGSTLKAMIYHVPSWTGFFLYIRHSLLKGRFRMGLREVIFNHLESRGTKAYRTSETRSFLQMIGYTNICLTTKLGPGDLLTIKPSKRYDSVFLRVLWRFYPRSFIRAVGDRYGLCLLIQARKPGGCS
ncbi:class I SAM-dependent methyltransferase [Acidobacteria bacterium AH-259-A15]|nr:class I SAM-dependent methyltransferase [Acidobacteria bacterium AH-259-A15]